LKGAPVFELDALLAVELALPEADLETVVPKGDGAVITTGPVADEDAEDRVVLGCKAA